MSSPEEPSPAPSDSPIDPPLDCYGEPPGPVPRILRERPPKLLKVIKSSRRTLKIALSARQEHIAMASNRSPRTRANQTLKQAKSLEATCLPCRTQDASRDGLLQLGRSLSSRNRSKDRPKIPDGKQDVDRLAVDSWGEDVA